jgi:hypothetical protein
MLDMRRRQFITVLGGAAARGARTASAAPDRSLISDAPTRALTSSGGDRGINQGQDGNDG